MLNFIGLIAAAAAGAAQVRFNLSTEYGLDSRLGKPMMSLLFGNLTKDFVNFTMLTFASDAGDAAATAAIPEAAAAFRRVAALDASYLVYIGEWHIPMIALGGLSDFLLQVSECSSARTSICTSGSILARSTQSELARNT